MHNKPHLTNKEIEAQGDYLAADIHTVFEPSMALESLLTILLYLPPHKGLWEIVHVPQYSILTGILKLKFYRTF